ncbi:MAG: sigma-70 family RNA polymerase sigma factor [Gaiellaceae bacterium]
MAPRVKETVKNKGARLEDLEQLYRERYAHFVQVARAVVGNEAAAHDAVQEGFSHAIRERRSFRGDGPLEAWLWRAVVNAAKSSRRRKTAFDPFETAPEAAANGQPDEDKEIRAWIAALPERQRLVVFLRYYADLDYGAIATALGIKTGTVSATLNAAHAALRLSISTPVEVSK